MEVFTYTKAGKLSKEDIQMMVALQENAHRLNAYSVNAHRNNDAIEANNHTRHASKIGARVLKLLLFYALLFVYSNVLIRMEPISALPEVYQLFAQLCFDGVYYVIVIGALLSICLVFSAFLDTAT